MREALDRELSKITELLLRMASRTRAMLADATEALVEGKAALAEEVIREDEEVDRLEYQIEDEVIATIARHQPVATDLRFLVTVLKAITDLERAGDYAAHVAEDALLLAQEPPLKRYVLLPQMARRLLEMIDQVAKSIAEKDAGAALKVLELDDEVDDLYEQLTRELITYMLEDPRTIGKSLTLLRVARSYERFGDHLENIAERVVYWLTGETPHR